jgi:IS605 OrfB family transposase
MTGDGTVLARRFINFPGDKDRIVHVLGRIRRKQRERGSACRGLWNYAVRLNAELAKKTAGEIVRFAKENGADVIVFEHLEMKGKIRGSKKQRLHMWRKRDAQRRCEHLAHRNRMRISRVCAWNTSALAFDGSGKVKRDPGNHSLCVFPNGKKYNCDLSASYNIGARYFIRELIKPLPETARSLLEAKVPAVMRRTSCVYADLLAMNDVFSRMAA